jgi:hypothetical protein
MTGYRLQIPKGESEFPEKEADGARQMGDAVMATASFAYCVGRDQTSRQKLADLFAETGLCIGREAASLKSLIELGEHDPKPSIVLIDLNDLPADIEDDLQKVQKLFPNAEVLVTCTQGTTPVPQWDPWADIIERRTAFGNRAMPTYRPPTQ